MRRIQVCCAIIPLLIGCGDQYEMAPVTGTITVDGKPLALTPPLGSGMVTFVPKTADVPYAYGEIGPDGKYVINTPDYGDGAVVGQYAVMISAGEYESESPEAVINPLLSRKYSSNQTSGLTAEVKSGEDNVIDFEVEPAKKRG